MKGIVRFALLALLMVATVTMLACSDTEYEAALAEHEAAVTSFDAAVVEAEAKNAELQDAISSAQTAIDSGDLPFDEDALSNLESAIEEAATAIVLVPEITVEIEGIDTAEELRAAANDINVATESLTAIDYSDLLDALTQNLTAFEDSVRQLQQVTAPTDDFIIERIEDISTITGTAAVSEGNDPNNNLNTEGGYIAAVFFSDSQVNQATVFRQGRFANPILNGGTDGGGSIEVYATEDDAQARYIFLNAFSGTVLDPGSHYVLGTIVIRTSTKLSDTQQEELTELIRESLLELR